MSSITFGGKRCVDPESVYQACRAQGLPTDWYGKPNRFDCPTGRDAGIGWLLMRRPDMLALTVTELGSSPAVASVAGGNLVLNDGTNPPMTLWGLTITSWESVAPGARGDLGEVLLVRVADARHFWDRSETTGQIYNGRYPDGIAYQGSTWTWASLYASVAGLSGVSNAIPRTPHGTPEGFDYEASPRWFAACDMFDRLGMTARLNPTTFFGNSAWLNAVRVDVADSAADAVVNRLDGHRDFDSYRQIGSYADRPISVKVVFRRLPVLSSYVFGTAGQQAYYQIRVDLPGKSSAGVGKIDVLVYDDLYALFDNILSPADPSNLATLTARAAERASVWDNARSLRTGITTVYHGFHSSLGAVPGAKHSGVSWYDVGQGPRSQLWATERDGQAEWRPTAFRPEGPVWEMLRITGAAVSGVYPAVTEVGGRTASVTVPSGAALITDGTGRYPGRLLHAGTANWIVEGVHASCVRLPWGAVGGDGKLAVLGNEIDGYYLNTTSFRMLDAPPCP